MMIPVLTGVLAVESALAMLLISKVPWLERMACMLIDLTKTQKGSAAMKTLAAVFLVYLATSVSTYVTAQRQLFMKEGRMGPDQTEIFVLRTAQLEASLTAFIMLLAVMINRTHYYLRGKRGLTAQLEVLKKQSKGAREEYMRLKKEGGDSSDSSGDEVKKKHS